MKKNILIIALVLTNILTLVFAYSKYDEAQLAREEVEVHKLMATQAQSLADQQSDLANKMAEKAKIRAEEAYHRATERVRKAEKEN